MTVDKHILITGANGGIGFEVIKLLAKQNAKLTLLYHENSEKIEKLKSDLEDTCYIEIKKSGSYK